MKRLLTFFTVLVLLSLNPVFAYDYSIDSYDVNMVVNNDKTMNIAETINADFFVPKHGIFRDIPTFDILTKTDDTKSRYKAKITNIRVEDNPYTLEKNTDTLRIKIGDANQTISGKKQYVIKYKYFMGNDSLSQKDEFYFNIIGGGWDIPIKNISFVIKMPNKFDTTSKIGFSSGTMGMVETKDVVYNIKDNRIFGYYNDIIMPGEFLTLRIELPDKYFTQKLYEFNFKDPIIFLFILPLISLIISCILLYIYGHDGKMFEILNFNPPQGINPVEAAYIYRQSVTSKDISTLLIYLANKGYIKLENCESKPSLFDCKIIKLKPYDGSNITERTFMNAIFKDEKKEIFLSDLQENAELYKMAQNIINIIPQNIHVFEKSSLSKQKIIQTFMGILFMAISWTICSEANMFPLILHITFFSMIAHVTFIKPIIVFICTGVFKNNINLILGIGFTLFSLILFVIPLSKRTDLIPYFVGGILCILAMEFVCFYMPKWTHEGKKLYQMVLGFKKYLEKVEVDRLKKLAKEDPQYFYNILPFTYVFGLSNEWIKKFENITYDDGQNTEASTFNHSMDHIIESTTTACTPPNKNVSSSSSDNGSFGGGGSSGGGGSW